MGIFLAFLQLETSTLVVNIALIFLSIYLITRKNNFNNTKISPKILGYVLLILSIIAFVCNVWFLITILIDILFKGSAINY